MRLVHFASTQTYLHLPLPPKKRQLANLSTLTVSPPNTNHQSPKKNAPNSYDHQQTTNKKSTMAHGRDPSLKALSPALLARANLSPS